MLRILRTDSVEQPNEMIRKTAINRQVSDHRFITLSPRFTDKIQTLANKKCSMNQKINTY